MFSLCLNRIDFGCSCHKISFCSLLLNFLSYPIPPRMLPIWLFHFISVLILCFFFFICLCWLPLSFRFYQSICLFWCRSDVCAPLQFAFCECWMFLHDSVGCCVVWIFLMFASSGWMGAFITVKNWWKYFFFWSCGFTGLRETHLLHRWWR